MTGNLRLTEANFVERVIQTAQLNGWRVAHFRPARTSRGWRTPMQGDPGFPDLVLARDGQVLLAEAKSDRGRLGAGQPEWLDAAGDHARLWRPRDWHTVLDELSTKVVRQP